jgi:hypothetical protein
MASDEYIPQVGDEIWMDKWRRPDGDIAYLPTTNRTAYLRQEGWHLLEPKSYDVRAKMAADGAAAKDRGLTSDTGGKTYPPPFPA